MRERKRGRGSERGREREGESGRVLVRAGRKDGCSCLNCLKCSKGESRQKISRGSEIDVSLGDTSCSSFVGKQRRFGNACSSERGKRVVEWLYLICTLPLFLPISSFSSCREL